MPQTINDFYIGYHSHLSTKSGRFLKTTIFFFILFCSLLAFSFIVGQKPFPNSVFEFGNYRTFHGTVLLNPYPHLLVRRPGLTGNTSQLSSYLLVAPFKFGAETLLTKKKYNGKQVTLMGSLIYKGDQVMIELLPASIQILGEGVPKFNPPPFFKKEIGKTILEGEIVGSKCYLGVMKPAERKIHRSCAIRCISGGVPPLFVVTNEKKEKYYFLLVSRKGKAVNKEVLPYVAKPIQIRGDIEQKGSFLILRANPKKDYEFIHKS